MDNYKKIRMLGELADAIKKEVIEFKIADPEDIEFKAAVLFFFIERSGKLAPLCLPEDWVMGITIVT